MRQPVPATATIDLHTSSLEIKKLGFGNLGEQPWCRRSEEHLIPGLYIQVPGEKLHHNLAICNVSSLQLTLELLDFIAIIISHFHLFFLV